MDSKFQYKTPFTQLTISAQYEWLFTVSFRHEYYTDGVCGDFVVEPSTNCATILRQYRLKFLRFPGGFGIAYEKPAKGGKLILQLDRSALELRFILASNNSQFVNFTDIPFKTNEQVYHFNNLAFNANSNGEERLLSNNATVGESDLKLKSEVLATNDTQVRHPFGVIDIIMDDERVEKKNAIRHTQLLKRRDYILAFSAREANWRYCLAPQAGSPAYNGFEVVDLKGEQNFNKAKEITFTNGIKGISIDTQAPIKFKQAPDTTFQLRLRRPKNDTLFTLDLANALPQHLRPDGVGNYFCEVFVAI